MSIAFALIVGTTFLMNAEQALDAAASAIGPAISTISESEGKLQLEPASPVSPVDTTPESEDKVTAAIVSQETNASATPTPDASTPEVNSATETIETEVTETEVTETEVTETEVVETEVVETEAVETEAVETEAVETDVVETDVVETDVVETDAVEPEAAIENDTTPESDELIEAWPHLSEHTRAAILMLVEADQMMR